jgi:hypothetical protein
MTVSLFGIGGLSLAPLPAVAMPSSVHVAVCIALCAMGHIFRDGWPATRSTHLARLGGGFWCLGGALAVDPGWHAPVYAAAVWLGYYFDMKHGEGQGADNWASMGFLALSGVTSLALVAGAAAWLDGPWWALVALAGLAKSAIWPLCWRVKPDRWWAWAQPTRIAAATFGAVVGAIIAAAG